LNYRTEEHHARRKLLSNPIQEDDPLKRFAVQDASHLKNKKWIPDISILFKPDLRAALLPKTLSLIPVETIETAVKWLENNGFLKVCIYGVSTGAA